MVAPTKLVSIITKMMCYTLFVGCPVIKMIGHPIFIGLTITIMTSYPTNKV